MPRGRLSGRDGGPMSSDSTAGEARKDRRQRAWVAATVRRIQRGEDVEEGFGRLFREYEPAVRRILRHRGWRGADLDDLVQDVMLRVYRGLGSFRRDASFDTWILQIVRNAAANAQRDRSTAKARAGRPSLEGLLAAEGSGPALPEPESPAGGPLDDALAAERKTRLAAALEELPARVRQCLLFRYQGYKYREIADAQGVTVATVKKQVTEGHKRLRPILGRFAEVFALFLALPLFRRAGPPA